MNPLFKEIGNAQPAGTGMMQEFQKFVHDMQGRDPNEEIRKLLQSGRISQQQLNEAQQMAHRMRNMFGRR